MSNRKPLRYTRRVGALVLTVRPLTTAGRGEHPRTYVARVDLTDVMVDGWPVGNVNVACKHIGAVTPTRAYARAFNVGHRLLVTALIAGVGR